MKETNTYKRKVPIFRDDWFKNNNKNRKIHAFRAHIFNKKSAEHIEPNSSTNMNNDVQIQKNSSCLLSIFFLVRYVLDKHCCTMHHLNNHDVYYTKHKPIQGDLLLHEALVNNLFDKHHPWVL